MLDKLNNYSNLVVAAVTIIYVLLTALTLREMRIARAQANAPAVIASLMPLDSLYAQIAIQNVGPNPALNIEATWILTGAEPTPMILWRHPALMPSTVELFRLPFDSKKWTDGFLPSLRDLACYYNTISIDLKWKDANQKLFSSKYEFNLKETMEGWYKAYWSLPEDPITDQIGKISLSLEGITSVLKRKPQAEVEISRDEHLFRKYSKDRITSHSRLTRAPRYFKSRSKRRINQS